MGKVGNVRDHRYPVQPMSATTAIPCNRQYPQPPLSHATNVRDHHYLVQSAMSTTTAIPCNQCPRPPVSHAIEYLVPMNSHMVLYNSAF
ncbi:hypothetical protein Lalb_Chr12g0208871 [Lupinus albus]|uniref:Uncharacterized protein n=1 Tax=Lupinus albus TaxID=3870 RepID=A0A6A4PP60_LUPAL|nr:hypothetical protein Lalb_Chr12g0208871 [Lupinus albus]